jgi:pimeloyl-ACP methyl ester carboxylesterase
VPAPLGVIWGAEDKTVPVRLADAVREARPDASVVIIERAGHVAMVERPEVFVETLERLLATLPKDATSSRRSRSKVP